MAVVVVWWSLPLAHPSTIIWIRVDSAPYGLAKKMLIVVERATALGFFFGFGLGTFVLAINALT